MTFSWPDADKPILQELNLTVTSGERVFLAGPSGSGKTTLLNLIGGLITPQYGCLHFDGVDMGALSQSARDRFRADHIGFIFQQFNLIPYLDMLDNVLLPLRFSPKRRRSVSETGATPVHEASRLLQALFPEGLSASRSRVTRLSVGQQQRVAVARALIGAPSLVVADEPTSSLDYDARANFIELLFREAGRAGSAILFVSHDPTLRHLFDRALSIDELIGT